MNRALRHASLLLGMLCLGLFVAIALVEATSTTAAAQEAQAQEDAPEPDLEREGVLPRSEAGGVVDGSEEFRRGAEVFEDNCSTCHGLAGQGRLGPALAENHNLARTDYLLALILRGGDGMPAFHARLSETEILLVSEYIRNAWDNDFGEVEDEQLSRQWWRGAENPADLYLRVCSRCHGSEGGGEFGPALAGNENLRNAQYVAGKILHGQGGMPAFEGLLAPEQVTELASFVRTAFGNQFGPVELDTILALQNIPGRRGPGILEANVIPADSRLTVVGPDRFVRHSSGTGRMRLTGLVAGKYSVIAGREGYQSAETEVVLPPGASKLISIDLQPFEVMQAEELRSEQSASASMVEAQIRTVTLDPTRPTDYAAAASDSSPGVVTNLQAYLRSCALCHGPEGEGGVGPALAGNPRLQDPAFVINRVLQGAGRMPAFGYRLTNEQIAAITTHERTAWGNGFGQITAEQVASQRQEPASQQVPSPALASGDVLFETNCAICHGSFGTGSLVAPPLRANVDLMDPAYTISRIVMGSGGMPPFGDDLSNAELAAVTTYIRTAWGNDFGLVSTSQAQNYHGGSSTLEQ